MEPPIIEADEVILPGAQRPGGGKDRGHSDPAHHDATAKIVARWLDDLIKIPGTKFSLGLDPLIALVPGIGDILSNSVSAVVIVESVRKGVAASVIMRMAINMLINALLDGIPLAGPVASAFYKSNSRNLALLQRWEEGEHKAVRRGSRLFLMTLVCIFFMLLGATIVSYTLLIWSFIRIPMKLLGF